MNVTTAKGLVTNYREGAGGYKMGGGGHVKFYPYERGGGGRKSFSHDEGGRKTFLGSFYMEA